MCGVNTQFPLGQVNVEPHVGNHVANWKTLRMDLMACFPGAKSCEPIWELELITWWLYFDVITLNSALKKLYSCFLKHVNCFTNSFFGWNDSKVTTNSPPTIKEPRICYIYILHIHVGSATALKGNGGERFLARTAENGGERFGTMRFFPQGLHNL